MAFKESLARLDVATLHLRTAPTRLPPYSALVAENVEFYPRATVAKRSGFKRREDLCMYQPITAYVAMDGEEILVGFEVNEL